MRSFKRWTLLVGAVMLVGASVQARSVSLAGYGFEMDLLDADPPAGTHSTAIATFLPARDGIAPNVNVGVQSFAGSMDEYIALSKSQFTAANFAVVSERRVGADEWIVEYSGQMSGTPLHWYGRGVRRAGRVYLVTATSAQASWTAVEADLKRSVHSFRLR